MAAMTLPRTSTSVGADRPGPTPSNTRTLRNRVSAGGSAAAAAVPMASTPSNIIVTHVACPRLRRCGAAIADMPCTKALPDDPDRAKLGACPAPALAADHAAFSPPPGRRAMPSSTASSPSTPSFQTRSACGRAKLLVYLVICTAAVQRVIARSGVARRLARHRTDAARRHRLYFAARHRRQPPACRAKTSGASSMNCWRKTGCSSARAAPSPTRAGCWKASGCSMRCSACSPNTPAPASRWPMRRVEGGSADSQ